MIINYSMLQEMQLTDYTKKEDVCILVFVSLNIDVICYNLLVPRGFILSVCPLIECLGQFVL